MKLSHFLCFFAAGFGPAVLSSAQSLTEGDHLLVINDPQPEISVVLTLDQCLGIALSESPVVQIAGLEIERVDYTKRDVLAQLLPSIDFGVNYSRTLAKQTMYMNMDRFSGMGGGEDGGDAAASGSRSGGGNETGIKVGLDNSYSMGFNASMPLIAPQLWKSLSLSDTQILRSVESARQSSQNLVNQVKNAYYSYLLAIDSKKVIRESYDMAALTYETYSKKYALGAASDYDVLRTSVAMKNIEPELAQADIAVKQAALQLRILMGVGSDFNFSVAGQLADHEKDMYRNALNTDTSISNNSDLRLLDIDRELAQKNISLQKLAFVPTLALTANYNWTSMSNGNALRNFRWSPYSTIGLSLSVPIFRGGSRYNAVKESKIQLAQLNLQRTNLERSIRMQVDLAVDNINVNIKQVTSCSESVAQADRAHTIMAKSFDIGAASYLDLRDSELALTRSRLAYYQAIYNYLVSTSQLELLLGNAPIDEYLKTTY